VAASVDIISSSVSCVKKEVRLLQGRSMFSQ
jgi:hypothetical protein